MPTTAEQTILLPPVPRLTLAQVDGVVRRCARVEVTEELLALAERSHTFLKHFAQDKVIYGINTGFGPMAQYRVPEEDLRGLQYNIILSHSTGAGQPLRADHVRGALLARLLTFAQGCSGVHAETLTLLARFLNEDIVPYVPRHGSVGASGDLVQLAHIALTLIGQGQVMVGRGAWEPTEAVLSRVGIEPLRMYLREGLALTNGTSVMVGIGLVNLIEAHRLLAWAVMASSLLNEVAASYDDFASEALNVTKLHAGQQRVAARMREWLRGSEAVRSREAELYCTHQEAVFDRKVQPYYSLRCVPQVLGPVLDTVEYAERIVLEELHSVCDNPVVDMDGGTVLHGGNFHGDYVSLEMDKLKIAIGKLTMLAERQINYLMHDRINGVLPPFANMGRLGYNYGLQAAQFTATSTTAESQTLAYPMYLHSIPCNNDNQDIVSMGTNGALLCSQVLENGYQVLAVLMMTLVQSVDILSLGSKLSSQTRRQCEALRTLFPPLVEDRPLYEPLEAVRAFLYENDPEEV